jgi:hypothetical protein
MVPFARGIVERPGFIKGLESHDPECAKKLAAIHGFAAVVIDHGVAEVFDVTNANPYRFRIYVTQTEVASGKELCAEWLGGHSIESEAQRAADNHAASMIHGRGHVDARGVRWDVVIRNEPYPEYP